MAQKKFRSLLTARRVSGFLVAALAIWLLVQRLDWSSVRTSLEAADYRWVVGGGVAIVATLFTRYRRWQVLLGHLGLAGPTVFTALLVGQVLNLVTPARGGDLARALWVAPERKAHVAEVLGTIAVEKVSDLLALLACTLVLLFLMPLPTWMVQAAGATALALALLAGGVWATLNWKPTAPERLGVLQHRVPQKVRRSLQAWWRRLAAGLATARRPRVWAHVLFWTSLTWAGGGLANLFVLSAFDLPWPAMALFLLVALMAGGAVPVPGSLGIFEGITVVSLVPFGVPPERALAVGLVLHLVVVAPPLLMAALLLLWPSVAGRKP